MRCPTDYEHLAYKFYGMLRFHADQVGVELPGWDELSEPLRRAYVRTAEGFLPHPEDEHERHEEMDELARDNEVWIQHASDYRKLIDQHVKRADDLDADIEKALEGIRSLTQIQNNDDTLRDALKALDDLGD